MVYRCSTRRACCEQSTICDTFIPWDICTYINRDPFSGVSWSIRTGGSTAISLSSGRAGEGCRRRSSLAPLLSPLPGLRVVPQEKFCCRQMAVKMNIVEHIYTASFNYYRFINAGAHIHRDLLINALFNPPMKCIDSCMTSLYMPPDCRALNITPCDKLSSLDVCNSNSFPNIHMLFKIRS